MIDILTDARASLATVLAQIHFQYPRHAPNFPCGVLFESENRVHARADGCDFLHEIELTLEIWALSPGETHALSVKADERLRALGLKRTYSTDLFDQSALAHRRVMRYRALSDENGTLCQ